MKDTLEATKKRKKAASEVGRRVRSRAPIGVSSRPATRSAA